MARFDNSCLYRNLRNSIGTTTFSKFRGIPVAKSKIMENTSCTPLQQSQRKRWLEYLELADLCGDAIEIGFPGRPRHQSPENAFIHFNKNTVTVSESQEVTIDYENLLCSSGRLKAPGLTATLVADTKTINFELTVTASYSKRCAKTDAVHVLVIEKNLQEACLFNLGTREKLTTSSQNLPDTWDMQAIEIYAFVTSADGKKASKSTHVTPA